MKTNLRVAKIQAADRARAAYTQKNAGKEGYSLKALEQIANGTYRKNQTQNKVPELKPNTKTTTKPTTRAKIPSGKNLRDEGYAQSRSYNRKNLKDRGYTGSVQSRQIDFNHVLKNDKVFGSKGIFSGDMLKEDLNARRKGKQYGTNEAYYKRFGMSADEVLDQYEKYMKGKEREKAEKHPILTALKDVPSALDRSYAGAAGTLAKMAFPNSDLDEVLNSDAIQGKVRDVQERRDYIQDSRKLSDSTKALANLAAQGGDTTANILESMLLAGTGMPAQIIGGASGAGLAAQGEGILASTGFNSLSEGIPNLMRVLNGVAEYGRESQEKKHEYERRGYDEETANSLGNAEGIASGAIMAALSGGGAAGEIAKGYLPAIKTGTASGAKFGGGRQLASEIIEPAILGEDSNFGKAKQKYLAQGMSEAEATIRALAEAGLRVGGATATGGIAGGILGGAGHGLSQLLGGNANVGNLNEFMARQEALPMNDNLALPQNDIPALDGVINQLALPEQQLPANVIELPGTNGTIELPDLNAPIANQVANQAAAVMGTAPIENTQPNIDFKPSIHNADGQLLNTVKIPEYKADSNVFFNGSDTDIALAEAQEAAIIDTFNNIISDPEFNALSFKNGKQEVYVSPSTIGNGYRVSYTVDGVPTGHHDYSLDEMGELSQKLREMAGNGGEDIKIQRKSDSMRQNVAGETAPANIAEQTPKNPTITSEPIEGADQAKARHKELSKQLVDLNKEIAKQKELFDSLEDKKSKGAERKAAGQKLAEMQKQAKAIQREKSELSYQMKGEERPFKRYMQDYDRDAYNAIYGKEGIMGKLDYATHFAGDTPEAIALRDEIKKIINDTVQSGEFPDEADIWNKVEQLDNMARTTKQPFTSKKGKNYDYDTFFAPSNTDEYSGLNMDVVNGYHSALRSHSSKAVTDRITDALNSDTFNPVTITGDNGQQYRIEKGDNGLNLVTLGEDGNPTWLDNFKDGKDLLNKFNKVERDGTKLLDEALDNSTQNIYNNVMEGGAVDGDLQTSRGNDGTGSEGLLRGIRETGTVGEAVRGTEPQGRGQLSGDSVFSTDELSTNPKAFDDSNVQTLAKNNIETPNFIESNNSAERFADAFEAARQSNKYGAAVDARDAANIQEIIDNGGKVFLIEDGTMGFAVEGDGNLTAVFKHSDNPTKGMAARATLAAIKNGAYRGDCYGRKLVNMYSMGGFEPVGRMKYGYGFNDEMDAQVREQLAEGKIKKEPDVYVLKLRDGYDFDTAAKNFNTAKQYSQAELDTLPEFDDYNEMLAYRDSLIKQPEDEAASSMPENGYWLRILGDPNFLAEQAQAQGVNPQTLVSYANQNLGFENIPQVTPNIGNVPPDNDIPAMDGVIPGKGKKTSQYYTNTMRNTEENAKMSDAEYHSHFDESEYQYDPTSNDESVAEGRDFIKAAGGHDGAVNELLNGTFDEEKAPFTHKHVDAAHILADEAEKAARELEAQGLDASDKWLEAHKLHKKIRQESTRNAQAMQALQKWKTKTPQGAVDNIISEVNRAIDQKKTKGYTAMVENLADEVEDAIRDTKGPELTNKIQKIFSNNRKKSSYKTDKYEQMVLDLVGGEGSKKRSSADLAAEAGRLIKQKMGVSTITVAEERAMLNLLEEAGNYEQGSRAYNELVSRAMSIFDATLPSSFGDKLKSIMYDNMLASIKTVFTRNLGGNLGANAIENVATPFQVAADWLVSKKTGVRSRTLSGKAIIDGTKGLGKGFKDVALDLRNGVNTARSGQDSMKDALNAVHQTFKTQSNNKFVKGVNRAANVYDRTVRKLMEGGDRPIYEAKYAATKAELYDLVDKYGDEGLRKGLPKGKDYNTDELIEFIAINDALEAVLQNDSVMKEAAKALKQAIGKSSEDMLGFDVASMSTVPFVEVPANMASRFFQYTPVGILGNVVRTAKEKIKYGEINQRRFTGELGRNILGGLMSAGAVAAAAKGYISGPYSKDKDEKKLQQNNSYQEYAVQTPNGDTQVDISDIPNVGPMTRYGKMQYDAYQEGGIPALIANTPKAIGAASIDTLYQGLNKLTGSSNKYSSGDSILENAQNAVMSSLGSLALPSIIRQTAQYLDPYKRDLGDYGTMDYNKNLIINGVPKLREMMLEPKIDTSGEKVKEVGGETGVSRFLNTYVAPWKITHPNKNISDAQRYAQEIKEKTNGEVNPQPPVFNANDLKQTKGYDAEHYEHSDLRKLQEDFYSINTERADKLISNNWFKKLPYDKQGKYLDELYTANKELTKEDFVREGKTPEQIEQAGDTLYTGDSKLTKILREDSSDDAMLEYFKNESDMDALNDKYDSKLEYDTYVKWKTDPEKVALGGATAYASNYNKVKELEKKYDTQIDMDDYLKYQKEYPGGAIQRFEDKKKADELGITLDQFNKAKSTGGAAKFAADKKAAERAGVVNAKGAIQTSQYQKAKDKAGKQWRKLDNDLPALTQSGLSTSAIYTYANALNTQYGSSINPSEYVRLYNTINTNKEDDMTQTEILQYLNKGKYTQEEANRLWTIYGENWKQVPALVNGTWKKKKKK